MIFLSDEEIAIELGLSLEKWQSIAVVLEKNGLPRRDALFSDRRCWPAVLEFLVKRAGGSSVNAPIVKKEVKDEKGSKGRAVDTRPKDKKEPGRKGAIVLDLQRARRDIGLHTKNGPNP